MTSRPLAATVVALGCVVAAACGAGDDSAFQRIDSADLFGLDETTTTSSTTTTTTTTTILAPPSSAPIRTSTSSSSTTIATEPVELYFLDGTRLDSFFVPLVGDPSATRVMAALESGPPAGTIGVGLRSFVPRSLITTVRESAAGFATVDLAAGAFEDIDPRDQRFAIAQIVLTLTRRPGIGQVQFTLDGEPLGVPGRDGVQTERGAPVSRVDYESLLVGSGPDGEQSVDETTTTETTVELTVDPTDPESQPTEVTTPSP